MFFPFFDPTYLLLIPAILLALYAQFKVKSTYAKYAEVGASSRISGAQVARQILDRARLENVRVEMTEGHLTDHYDPRDRVLRLSHDIYHGASLSALGIAAHEAGHAIQHAQSYYPMSIRASLVPVVGFGSSASFPLFFIGMLFHSGWLMDLGIIFFIGAVLFHLVTLPVEFNASGRALQLLEAGGFMTRVEIGQTKKVLNAAALTYVASAAMAILELVRLIFLRNSSDD